VNAKYVCDGKKVTLNIHVFPKGVAEEEKKKVAFHFNFYPNIHTLLRKVCR